MPKIEPIDNILSLKGIFMQAVILSYDEYSSMKETLYLLSSKNNRERLLDAVEEIENLQFIKKEIDI